MHLALKFKCTLKEEEELDDLEELRENVAQRSSKSCEKETIEKEHYGNVKLEDEDNENVFCNVTSIFDEEQIYQFKCDECPEQFMLKSHMKNHVMTHIAITAIYIL